MGAVVRDKMCFAGCVVCNGNKTEAIHAETPHLHASAQTAASYTPQPLQKLGVSHRSEQKHALLNERKRTCWSEWTKCGA